MFNREGAVIPGIRLIPIDSNENGMADPAEILGNQKQAIMAIESGRYPATRKNYFFIKNNPSPLVKEFIRFALSEEGTRIVEEVATSLPVPQEEREKILKGL